ncbi:MAG: DotA/TraY family protein [Alphaproteobacteria bacterium]|nr:DotA/TraY family protein [Alphaproteobacteria bacterium]
MAVTTTRFVQYSVFPGIWPRIKGLLGSGLSFLSGTLAVVYFNLGLLPTNHPYLSKQNYGRFGVRHVVAAAGKNLTFSWRHTDQIVLYFTILIGLVILSLQFIIVVISILFYAKAFAVGTVLGAYDAALFAAFGGSIRDIIDVFFSGVDGWTTGWIVFAGTAAGPSQDIAFVVLDQVFGIMQGSGPGGGVEGFFHSCVSTPVACTNIQGDVIPSMPVFPSPMHLAMHQMFSFYTMGIAFISTVVLLYYIVTIIGETIVTGTPFGQRFNKAWVIPRLMMFFALLAPITFVGNNSGINVAQLITFSVAKFGSNFATNAWLVFVEGGVDQAANQYDAFFGISQSDMLAIPRIPELGTLVQYMYVVRMCMYAESLVHGHKVIPYMVRPPSEDVTVITLLDGTPTPYNIMGAGVGVGGDEYRIYDSAIPFADAVEFSRYENVVIRFGHRNPPGGFVGDPNNPPDAYDEEWGYIKPVCGEIQFEVTSLDPFVIGPLPGGYGTETIQDVYWDYIDEFLYWDVTFDQTAYCMLNAIIPYSNDHLCLEDPVEDMGLDDPGEIDYLVQGVLLTTNFPLTVVENHTQWLTLDLARASMEAMNEMNRVQLIGQTSTWNSVSSPFAVAPTSVHQQVQLADSDPAYISSLHMPIEVKQRGWAGAALWYNQLAQLNGLYASAVQNVPRPFKYPMVMEEVSKQHHEADGNSYYTQRFNPRLANGKLAELPRPGDQYIAAALYSVYSFWNSSAVQETVFTRKSNNPIIDTINMILGTNGIVDIVENRGTYPLAMLSSLGKNMVDAALRNLWVGVVGQGIGEIMDGFLGGLAKVGSSFAFRFGMIGLGIGFILYYVLPVLPFIYFFFAFSGWIKSIFEAVVAMPLWALAHMNIEGEGLPGPWASNGYFLLFEIFLRPILIIAGFVFSISIFTALVNALHDTYHVVVMVATGYNIQGEINNTNAGALSNFTSTDPMAFMRGPIDEMFYSIIYVIMVYMIGLSCFKLVDTIPNNIMRWMGVTVSSFHEHMGDPAGEMTGKLFRATQITNIQLIGLINKAQGFRDTSAQDTAALAVSTGGFK